MMRLCLIELRFQVIIPPEVSDREQGLKDRDFLLAARNNRELRKTLEYQEAKERDKSRFYEKIEIKEVTKPTPVIIGISSCLSLLIDRDRAGMLNQYEQDLKGSIEVLMTNLEQQQEQANEEKQQRQAEPQPEQSEQLEQSEQTQPELELSQDISNGLDFSIDNSEIYFTKPLVKPLVNKNLSRSDWHR